MRNLYSDNSKEFPLKHWLFAKGFKGGVDEIKGKVAEVALAVVANGYGILANAVGEGQHVNFFTDKGLRHARSDVGTAQIELRAHGKAHAL